MIFKRSQSFLAELSDILKKYEIDTQCNASAQEIADEVLQLLLNKRALAISKNF